MDSVEGLALLKGIDEKTTLMHKILTGNGDPSKGLVVRFDRVEVKIKRVDWILKALFYTAAAAAFTLIAELIVKAS